MSTPTSVSTSSARRLHPFVYVLAAGLVVGTIDIVYAIVFWAIKADVPALRISAAGPPNADPLWVGMSVAVHVLLIGIPIALIVGRGLGATTLADQNPAG